MSVRAWPALLLALAAPAIAQPPDTATLETLPANGPDKLDEAGEILAARRERERMAVPVRINGQGPFRFIVDSGADRSVVGADLAARLALPPGRPVMLHGMAGSGRVGTVLVEELEVGSNRLPDVNAPALREADLGAQGLLGVDALRDQRVTMDFDRGQMTVSGSPKPEPGRPDEIVVTARRRFGQLILTQASVEGDPIYAVIDTGSQVTVGNSRLRTKLFGRRKTRSVPVTLTSVTGQTVVAEWVVLNELKLGGLTMRNVPVAFTDAPPFALFGIDQRPAMMLGTDLMRTFRRVSLDFKRKRVRFLLKR